MNIDVVTNAAVMAARREIAALEIAMLQAQAVLRGDVRGSLDETRERLWAGIMFLKRKILPELEFEDVFGTGNFVILRSSVSFTIPASTLRVQVVAGGSGGSSSGGTPGNGGNSSFGTHLSATGGTTGAAGTGSGGTTNTSGGAPSGRFGGARGTYLGLLGAAMILALNITENRDPMVHYGFGGNGYLSAGGGYGGGYSSKIISGLPVGQSIAATIGAGGAGGVNPQYSNQVGGLGMPGIIVVEW